MRNQDVRLNLEPATYWEGGARHFIGNIQKNADMIKISTKSCLGQSVANHVPECQTKNRLVGLGNRSFRVNLEPATSWEGGNDVLGERYAKKMNTCGCLGKSLANHVPIFQTKNRKFELGNQHFRFNLEVAAIWEGV